MPGREHAAPITEPEEIELWEKMTSHAGEPFTTSGRGKIPWKPFTYEIKGAEMFVSSRSKAITWSTVLVAYRKVKGKKISGPKAIGVHGDSYIYAVFNEIGIIKSGGLTSLLYQHKGIFLVQLRECCTKEKNRWR